MWFKTKQKAAPIYRDELGRRAFATASGRPKGADRLKKLKGSDDDNDGKRRGFFGWLFGRSDGGRDDRNR